MVVSASIREHQNTIATRFYFLLVIICYHNCVATRLTLIHISNFPSRLFFLELFRASKMYEKYIGISALLTTRIEVLQPGFALPLSTIETKQLPTPLPTPANRTRQKSTNSTRFCRRSFRAIFAW